MAKLSKDTPDWSSKTTRRNVTNQAKHLLKEARTLTKRHQKRLAPTALEDMTRAMDAVAAQLNTKTAEGSSVQPLFVAAEQLDAALNRHLASARKSTIREYVESIAYAVLIALFIRAFIFEAFKIPTGSMIPTLLINDHIFVNKLAYGVRIPFSQAWLFEWGVPERGEIIVFEYPKEGDDFGKDFIKRVVAVPNDRVRLVNNQLHINGEPIPVDVKERKVPCADHPTLRCNCTKQEETLGEHRFITQHLSENTVCAMRINNPNWPLERPEGGIEMYFGAADSNPNWPEVVIPEGFVMVMGDNRDNSSDGRYWGLVPLKSIRGRATITWYSEDRSRIFRFVK